MPRRLSFITTCLGSGWGSGIEGIQFELGAFNHTISCCMIHKTNRRPTPRPLPVYRLLNWPWFTMRNQRWIQWYSSCAACGKYILTVALSVRRRMCFAGLCEAAGWCMLVVVLTLLLTFISGGVRGPVACRALDSTSFTLHNWMQGGALQRGGLDGTGRKMDEVSSTFTFAALLHADFVLIQEFHLVQPLLFCSVMQSSVISTQSRVYIANMQRHPHTEPASLYWLPM